jgi:WD40 repeat protein
LCDLDANESAALALRTVRGHEGEVVAAAFSRDGSRLVTVDSRGTVKQWDPAARAPRMQTPFGKAAFRASVRPRPDGSRIAIAPGPDDLTHRFRITDNAGRAVLEQTLPPNGHCDDLNFSADGRTVALAWHDGINFTLFVWDAVSGREMLRRNPPGGMLAWVALAPDGSCVAATTVAAPNEQGWSLATLDSWDTATGRLLFSRRSLRAELYFQPVYSPDGRWVVINPGLAADGDCRLVWLDAQSGAEAVSVKLGSEKVPGLGFSRDGRRVAIGRLVGDAPSAVVWETAPILRGEKPTPLVTLNGHGSAIYHGEFSPDGRRLLTSGGGVVKLWDSTSGREVLSLKGGAVPLGEAFFSPDGHTIWAGLDEEGHLWGWDGKPVSEGKTQ